MPFMQIPLKCSLVSHFIKLNYMKSNLQFPCFVSCALLLSQALFPSNVAAQTLPLPTHIVVLWEENYAYSEIIGSSSAPHINALATDPNAAIFTNFFAIEHPSQPNYLDLFSGQNQDLTSDDYPTNDGLTLPFTTPNLCAQLLAAGKTFKTYSEDLPSVGSDVATYTAGSANYARKHNPCSNWSNSLGSGTNTYSDTVSQPFTAFPTPANYSSLPTVSFVVPNMTNDMHDYTCGSLPCPESITLGDAWMYNNLDSLRAWSLANNTLYILIYDEDDDNHGNNIPVIFYGPMVKAGTYTETVNLYNLLRTIEQIYSLPYAGNAATASAITDCWLNSTAVNKVTTSNYTFTISPNPASDVIKFNCNATPASIITITVSDAAGHIAGKYTMTGASLQVNTSAFASGVYSYCISNNNSNLLNEGKFIVTHN